MCMYDPDSLRAGSPLGEAPGHRSGEGSRTARECLMQEHLDMTARAAAARSKHIVLVVGEDETMRYATASALRALGFPVIEGATGAEALALVSAASVVVLETRLPDVDGFDVCRRLRLNARTAKVPVVHVSGMHVEETHRQMSEAAGADAVVATSVPPAHLAALLDELIERTLPTPV
jgi:CheY-like chemotaxis protein